MEINWFTFTIQIINFLILVALLKRFLYGQILKVMDEREALVAARLAAAEQKQQEARTEIELYQQKVNALDEQRAAMLIQIKAESEAQRKILMQQARAEVDQIRSSWHKTIQSEKNLFLQEFRHSTARQIGAVARRALTDLANVELEQQIVNTFIERLQTLGKADRAAVATSLSQSKAEIKICSAFELCPQLRQKMIKAVQTQFGDKTPIQFEVSPELVCGLELNAPGCQIAWNITDYLGDFEQKVSEALKAEAENKA